MAQRHVPPLKRSVAFAVGVMAGVLPAESCMSARVARGGVQGAGAK